MAPEPHNCSKSEVIDMIVNGQEKIFNKLDNMTGLLEGVALQKLEMDYLQKDVADLKSRTGALEQKTVSHPKTFIDKALTAAGIAIVVSVVTGTFWLFAFTAYKNIPDYVDAKQNGLKGATE